MSCIAVFSQKGFLEMPYRGSLKNTPLKIPLQVDIAQLQAGEFGYLSKSLYIALYFLDKFPIL